MLIYYFNFLKIFKIRCDREENLGHFTPWWQRICNVDIPNTQASKTVAGVEQGSIFIKTHRVDVACVANEFLYQLQRTTQSRF